MLGLKFARLNRGLSQAMLGYMAKLPQPLICLIETGRQNPTPVELKALARALGVADPALLLHEFPDPFVEAEPQAEAVAR
ncbi:MAG TPA: helix-turn-helix transcriptional regulator [Vicinamibacterales bacterium]|nr:helix-turn-helix transcriptional regulator [Vicinamibacterales bacterium]